MLREGDLWPGPPVSVPGNERKYHIRRQPRGGWNICVDVRRGWSQQQVFASRTCGDLVDAVNRVAMRFSGQPGGVFYWNEYGQVLKPVSGGNGTWELRYVGEFTCEELEFQLDRGTWNNRRTPSALSPGDPWPGPRVGIPYHIQKDGRIYRRLTGWSDDGWVRIEDRDFLDQWTNSRAHDGLSRALLRTKRGNSGSFTVTESGAILAPVTPGSSNGGWSYRYVGILWEYVGAWYTKIIDG